MARLIAAAAILLATLSAPAAQGAQALDDIRARLDAHPVLRAEFTQTRRIAALAKPIVSRGRFIVARPDGVAWQVELPYRTTYVLKQDVMMEIAADGSRTLRSEREAGAAARINQVVLALANGSSDALRHWFDAEASLDAARWRIALTPKQQQMAQYIKGVQLSGGEFVEEVAVVSSNGDETRIAFYNHRKGPLSDDERRLFAVDR